MSMRTLFKSLAPSWLTTEEGEQVLWSIGAVLDAFLQRMLLSVKVRFPQHAPADALSLMSRDRRIIRGLDESTTDYAARLIPWLDDHRTRGNPFAMLRQVRAYCGVPVLVRTVDNRGNWFEIARDGTESFDLNQADWDWDGDTASWSRFWLIIFPTTVFVKEYEPANRPWPVADDWGVGSWGDDPYGCFGFEGITSSVLDLRRLVKEWKPAGTRCEWIILSWVDTIFEPGDPALPAGEYGNWGENIAGSYTAARAGTARYLSGVDGGYA